MQNYSAADIQIIPAIDLRGGSCVRLHQGRFDEETVFDTDPVRTAKRIAQGARLLHVVDLEGAREGHSANFEVIARVVSAMSIPIQCGGGVRTADDARNLLDLGVSRIVLGSLAVEQPQTAIKWLRQLGPSRLVVALDARADGNGNYLLATQGWQKSSGKNLFDALDYFSNAGIRHVLCTDIERDGAMSGPSTALYAQLVSRFPQICLQASGGVRHVDDLNALSEAGVRNVVVGRALLEGRIAPGSDACRQSA